MEPYDTLFGRDRLNFDLLNEELSLSIRLLVEGRSTIPKERMRLRQKVRDQGFWPNGEILGSVRDLTGNAFLNFLLNFNLFRAYGFRNWISDLNEVALLVNPAFELVLTNIEKKVRLQWIDRWNAARRDLGSRSRALEATLAKKTSCINAFALKTDTIWKRISKFELAYPPFDYDLGITTIGVGRSQTIRLGLLKPDENLIAPDLSKNKSPALIGFEADLTKCGKAVENLFGRSAKAI